MLSISWIFITPVRLISINDPDWNGKRKVDFDIVKNQNQSGHVTYKISASFLGVQLEGTVKIPPTIPKDYVLFPGIGYYKYHDELATYDQAYGICNNEGGHLAVINSMREMDVLKLLFDSDQKFIGFNDRMKEGDFVTIFGDPMEYTSWHPHNPSGGRTENCGTLIHQGINDAPCNYKFGFICEFDLSWANFN